MVGVDRLPPRERPRLQSVSLRLGRDCEEDAQLFCELFNSLYTRRAHAAYYRWQFFETPFPSGLLFAMEDDGTLAGCYGFHVEELQGGSSKVGWALDIMVAPSFQGQGLFRRLAAAALEAARALGAVAMFVMANDRANGAHVRGLGWKRLSTLTTFVCDTAAAVESLPSSISIASVPSLSAWEGNPGRWSPRSGNRRTLYCRSRSCAFLQWRFERSAWYKYDFLEMTVEGVPAAYLAMKTFRDPVSGQRFGDVVDMFWDHTGELYLSHLVRHALGRFHSQGVTRAAMWLQTHTPLDEIGRSLGFRDTKQERFFCGSILDPRARSLNEFSHWFVTMADSEVY